MHHVDRTAVSATALQARSSAQGAAFGSSSPATTAAFTDRVKAMPRISTKNQITIPVAALEQAGLRAGDDVLIEALDDGELRVRRGAQRLEDAFGVLTGTFPHGYLERLDAEDAER
jgi:AbrB family looped-hinge helix DNA binding protein